MLEQHCTREEPITHTAKGTACEVETGHETARGLFCYGFLF